MTTNLFEGALNESLQVFASLRALEDRLLTAAGWCAGALRSGHKILACGNGGSACDAQHLVGELMGRYILNRPSLPAVALNADSAVLTCLANDYSYEDVYARQVKGLGQPGDVLVAFTTSGNSPNVLRALEVAREAGLKSVAFLGKDGGAAAKLADCTLIVSHKATARIQEGHQFLLHSLMDHIEAELGYSGR